MALTPLTLIVTPTLTLTLSLTLILILTLTLTLNPTSVTRISTASTHANQVSKKKKK